MRRLLREGPMSGRGWLALLGLCLAVALAVCSVAASGSTAQARSVSGQAAQVADPSAGFSFLAPLGPRTAPEGAVAEWLLPFLSVQVCVWDGSSCGRVVWQVTSAKGDRGQRIRLEKKGRPDAYFRASFKTQDRLAEGTPLRLRVLAGPAELAHRDLLVRQEGPPGGDPYLVRAKGELEVSFRILEEPFWSSLASLTTDRDAAPVGSALALRATPPVAEGGGSLGLLAGGEPASVVSDPAGGLIAGLPLFLDDDLRPDPPQAPLDLLLFRDGLPVAAGQRVIRALPLTPAPGSTVRAESDLQAIADAFGQIGAALSTEPGAEQQWLLAVPAVLDRLVTGDDPGALAGALAGADPQTRALLDDWLASSGVLSFLDGYQALLSEAASSLEQGNRRLASRALAQAATAAATPIGDRQLAEKMQFYAVVTLFGQQVIGQINEDWADVGAAAGVMGILGKEVPLAAAISAVLAVADFALNKVLVGLMPARVSSLDLALATTKLGNDEQTEATLTLTAVNEPPSIGLQDVLAVALNILGLKEVPEAESAREFLLQTANLVLGYIQGEIAGYAAEHPELNLDLTVQIPALSWQTTVSDPTLATPLSRKPQLIRGLADSINWQASSTDCGETEVFARLSEAGPNLLPTILGYTGGAFGDNSADSNAVGVTVCPPKVTIAPRPTSLTPGSQTQFTATVENAKDMGVTWSASGGTIDENGLYTAGDASQLVGIVTATSIEDPSASDTVTFTLAESIHVTIAPASVTLAPGEQQQFSATVDGTANQAVTWSATGGTIDQNGNYTAGSTTGAHTVTATSQQDANAKDTATVRVLPSLFPGTYVGTYTLCAKYPDSVCQDRTAFYGATLIFENNNPYSLQLNVVSAIDGSLVGGFLITTEPDGSFTGRQVLPSCTGECPFVIEGTLRGDNLTWRFHDERDPNSPPDTLAFDGTRA